MAGAHRLQRGAPVKTAPLVYRILACVALLSLPRDTWLRLGVWTAFGFLIYVFYGFRNSALRKGGR